MNEKKNEGETHRVSSVQLPSFKMRGEIPLASIIHFIISHIEKTG